MTRRVVNIFFVVIVLFTTLSSCRTSSTHRVIYAETLMERSADSAILLLTKLQDSALNKRDEAFRRLLLARAYASKGVTMESDSIIKPALDYYQDHDYRERYAEAILYYAMWLERKDQTKDAAANYLDVVNLLTNLSTKSDLVLKIEASATHALASLYMSQNHQDEAFKYYKHEVEIYEQIHDNDAKLEAQVMVAISMILNDHDVEGLELLRMLGNSTDDPEMKAFIHMSFLNYVSATDVISPEKMLEILNQIDYKAVEALNRKSDSLEWSESPLFLFNTISSFVYYRNGETSRAYDHIKEGLTQMGELSLLNVGYYKGAARMAYESKDLNGAFNYSMIYGEKLDSIHRAEAHHQIKEAEIEYRYQYANELSRTRSLYRTLILLIALVLLIICLVVGMWVYHRRLNERDNRIAEYMSLVDNYRQTNNSITTSLRESNERERIVKEYLSSRQAMAQQIASTCYRYGDNKNFAIKMRELALSPEMLQDVVQMSDLYNDMAVSRLREEFPGWNERHYTFAALVIAGFSAPEISVMLDLTLGGVYTLKSKIKTRILSNSAGEESSLGKYFI